MKFTQSHHQRLADADAEAARQNADKRISELQAHVLSNPNTGRLLAAPQRLTGTGTGKLPAGTKMVILRITGGGGGGGGAAGGANAAAGAGGNSGTYLEIVIGSIDGPKLPSSYSWSAGTGGAAGSAGGNGGTGGDSTFKHSDITYTAKGGAGGGGSTNGATTFGAPAARTAGSSAALVNVQTQGGPGFNAVLGGSSYFFSGVGGSNPMGGGGGMSNSTAANGFDGSVYGGAGGGAIAQATGRTGGAGADGGEIIECFG